MNDAAERVAALREAGLHRQLREVGGAQGARVLLDGREVLLLCSNNYLGLANHPEVRDAAAQAAQRWGAGAGASRLISGSMTLHRRLEERLAEFKGTEAALLFGSGYLANLGVVSALARRDEVVCSDELNHASIVDGCRLARADTFVYEHADLEHLEWGLKRARGRASLIVTDGVFSMDGDVAPLAGLAELAERYDCRLMVDEAHATGVLGPGGRGAAAAAGVTDQVDLIVGTLGKALGSYGAYVCANREIRELLVNVSRPFIFSTALPPPVVAAGHAALELVDTHPERVARLNSNAQTLRSALAANGFDIDPDGTQIVPVVVGGAEEAMALCDAALRRGVFAQAIRPPTVASGTSRLRLTVMATHRERELQGAASVLAQAAAEAGGTRASRAAGETEAASREAVVTAARRDGAGESRRGVGGAGRAGAGRQGFADWGAEPLGWAEPREEPLDVPAFVDPVPGGPVPAETPSEGDLEGETSELDVLRRAA